MDSELRNFTKFSKDMAIFHIVLNVFRIIFLTAGLASNLLVCFVMTKKKDHRKTLSKFFIFHLALADIVFRILGIHELIAKRVSHGVLSLSHCKIIVLFQYTCEAVLFVLLAGIALDRSKNIIHPLQSFKNSRYCHRKRTVALIWIYALSISAAFIYSATTRRFTRQFNRTRNSSAHNITNNSSELPEHLTYTSPRVHCVAGPRAALRSQIAFTIYFVCGFFLPLCIMIICYTKVFNFLSNRAKHSMLNRSVVRSKMKTVSILLLLVFSFLFSWGPITVLDLIVSFMFLGKDAEHWLRPIAEGLCYSSSILNPVIYAFGNEAFRKEASSLLFCNRKPKCLLAN